MGQVKGYQPKVDRTKRTSNAHILIRFKKRNQDIGHFLPGKLSITRLKDGECYLCGGKVSLSRTGTHKRYCDLHDRVAKGLSVV
jgi:hypothetical protein